ncbi:MAG TPA: winged helix DNA-binding domain-containing protein [Actinomycetota bacterium]|nr:winged helix DNA-binding domain-containing protein [Actinomycetota bacterium]
MRAIGVEERRARLALRHGLARAMDTVDEASAALVGLHSSDPATVYLSAWARVEGFAPTDLEDALYERRSLVRMLGMRRTLFVVPLDGAATMDAACTKALAPGQHRRLVGLLEEQGIAPAGGGERWLRRVAARTLESLGRRGEATARELTKDVPDLGARLTFGEGKTWGGTMGVSTRVLFLLAAEGRIVRARPLGSWTSGQYRWARTETWLGAPLPGLSHAEACTDLLRRWLRAFGPGTTTDIRWWTGWTAALTTKTLAAVGAVEVDLEDGATGYVPPDDLGPVGAAGPWVALLPALDPTVMGWKERGWYLGDHAAALFDRNGNAGPTVWVDGRAVGGWGQADDGTIAVELLERVDAQTRRAMDAERERLRAWLGDVRIKPRFRTPLELSLSRA